MGRTHLDIPKERSQHLGALLDIKKYGLNLRQEQFFIRLSSNKTIQELESMPQFKKITAALNQLGLPFRSQQARLNDPSRIPENAHRLGNISNDDGTCPKASPGSDLLKRNDAHTRADENFVSENRPSGQIAVSTYRAPSANTRIMARRAVAVYHRHSPNTYITG